LLTAELRLPEQKKEPQNILLAAIITFSQIISKEAVDVADLL
jgi:hypothetical protein